MSNKIPYKISTSTYTSKNLTQVCIKKIYENYLNFHFDDSLYIENKDTKINKKGQIIKNFYNQITFKSKDHKFNIKLFSNNTIQMTGIKAKEDIDFIVSKLEKIFNLNIVDIKMVMLNVTLNLSKKVLNLYKMYEYFKMNNFEIYYTPEIYPGLKLKYKKNTALIFATGNAIISCQHEKYIYEILQVYSKYDHYLQNINNSEKIKSI